MVKLEPGQRVGDYRLERRVGGGAFGNVWLAVEVGALGFRKRVALKLLKELDEAGPEHLETLVNEARLGGHLHHPHIVDVYGVGEHEGMWFIAMEFVPGGTLEDLKERVADSGFRLPRSVVLDVGIQIASALDHAHNARDHGGRPLHVIHRDLKPANVLMNPNAGVKVADFGIARAVTNVSVTQSGVAKGTPCYLAPEGWEGGRAVGPAVDIFALGAVLAELLLGTRLYNGGSVPAIVFQILQGNAAQDVLRLNPVFPELAPLLERMLKRDPKERIQQAAEVEQELRRIRPRTEAPGDLSLFLKLIGAAATPRGQRNEGALPLDLPTSNEPGWSEVLALARGEGSTLDGGGSALEGDPGATRRVAPEVLEAFLAGAGPGSATPATKPEAPSSPPKGPSSSSAPADLPPTYTASPESLARIKSDVAKLAAAPPVDTLASLVTPSPVRAPSPAPSPPEPAPSPPVSAPAEPEGFVFDDATEFDPEPASAPLKPPREGTRRRRRGPSAARRALPYGLAVGAGVLLLVGALFGLSNRSELPDASAGDAPPADLAVQPFADQDVSAELPETVDRAPASSGGVQPERTREPVREATPSPVPAASDPQAELAPTATPSVESEPEASPVPSESMAAAPTQGCVAFQSDLGGGLVWVDGALNRRLRTSRVDPPTMTFPAGRVSIGMARQGRSEPSHSVDVDVRAGWRHVVSCNLGSDEACAVSGGAGACP